MTDKREKEKTLREAAEALHTEPEQLCAVIEKFRHELNETESEITKLKKELKD
ncbi:MAG: hypothetical protein V1887_03205 [Candidatus Aenigmatarchaeota archaeon]